MSMEKDGKGNSLADILSQSVDVFPQRKIEFIHSLRESDFELIENVSRTAFAISKQEAAEIERDICAGRLGVWFRSGSPAIKTAFERWSGHHQKDSAGLRQCVNDILIAVAQKAKNGEKK